MPPLRFLVFATALIGLLHFYIGARLLPDLPVTYLWKLLGAAWLLASCVLLPLGLLAGGITRQPLSDRLAWIGLLAMGLFSSLLVLTVLRDAILLLFGALDLSGVLATPTAFAANSALAVPVLAMLASLAGFLNARRVASVVNVDVPITNLPVGLQDFTIAQISDIHVGPTIKRDYLERIVERVNALNADMVAVTGDLVDGSVVQLAAHTAPIANLHAHHGIFS
ncbi:MAG TPA: metallophosphoesterase [Rhodocyclaceae bacterium]|nr:metallophosphoesterase [Rhodocyclaceae bacterium]